jgi:uncharacterized protein
MRSDNGGEVDPMTITEDLVSQQDPLLGLSIIDSDTHFTEPPDLWTSRAAASMRDRMPVQKTDGDVTAWYMDGDIWAGIGGNTIAKGRRKVLGEHIVQPFADLDSAAWDVKARLALMDVEGIHAAVVYPNGVGFASNHIFSIQDLALRGEVLRIYNDFYVDIQEESGSRLLPQAMLPVWDMDLTVKEMERLLPKGITGFTVTDKPEKIGLPELDEPYFAPMWALANEARVPMNFHIGSGWSRAVKKDVEDVGSKQLRTLGETEKSEYYWSSFGPQRRLSILATSLFMSNVRIIANFCMSDMFDRYPNLKIVSAESGVSWLPFILESLEYQIDEMVTSPEERSLQKRRPTEYFHDHIFASFWFERVGLVPQIIEAVGVRNIMVETDVPHPTCLYPGARDRFAQALGHLDRNVIKRILFDNAAELYGVKDPSGQPS